MVLVFLQCDHTQLIFSDLNHTGKSLHAFSLFRFILPDYKSTTASITKVTWIHLVCLLSKVLVVCHAIMLQILAVGGSVNPFDSRPF